MAERLVPAISLKGQSVFLDKRVVILRRTHRFWQSEARDHSPARRCRRKLRIPNLGRSWNHHWGNSGPIRDIKDVLRPSTRNQAKNQIRLNNQSRLRIQSKGLPCKTRTYRVSLTHNDRAKNVSQPASIRKSHFLFNLTTVTTGHPTRMSLTSKSQQKDFWPNVPRFRSKYVSKIANCFR